ncbi:FAD-binding oxidoreductase [Actinomadura syzygii]|uniref:FAD-binding protein n=1 Tax=Actinomadura syzygii TaxID=1427538 RepID=A0A5D0TSI1_9ACTN|nr:FAD-linked oxidase C-terminal domain-containing protein [Actinomadura syzygii]TYC08255.1 FAD-binding protein [Actinomadura syzygii]
MDAVAALADRLPSGRVIADPDAMDAHSRDQTYAVPGEPLAVVLARDTSDVVTAVRWAAEHRVPIVPRGGGTGLAGGATATDGCLVLSLARMTAIRELAPADQLAVVEPGVITADLDRAAREHGLMYAPDPSSHEISTIGGNLATNAGGLRCVKYGVTRDSALGLEVVLADGRVIQTGGRTVKRVTGYDLTGLFVGSEGTLGVITSATVRLRPAPVGPPVTVLATFGSVSAAGAAAASIMGAGLRPSLLELIDRAMLRAIDDWRRIDLDTDTAAMIITQTDGPECPAEELLRHCEDAGADFAAMSTDEAEAAALLEIRRLAHPSAERLGNCLVEDVCVPRSRLPEMVGRVERAAERHGVTILTVAHAGDGNLHPVFIFERGLTEPPPDVQAAADEVFTAAIELGGTLTGEHGVGVLKRPWLDGELEPGVRDVQRQIKQALDPDGLMNPGKAI